MLEDAGGLFLRCVAHVVVEILLKLPGYGIQRLFRPADEIDPDGLMSLLLGLGFWAMLVAVLFGVGWLFEVL